MSLYHDAAGKNRHFLSKEFLPPPAACFPGKARVSELLIFIKSLDMSYEVTYKGHQRIDDTGKPYYVNEYTESYTVPTQYKVFFTLSLFCGFRKGETLALHWNDIDLREKKISISKSVGMTENGFDYL